MAGTYTNPNWHNTTSPAINETNLNNLSNAVVQNQTDVAALETLTADYATVRTNAAMVPTIAARSVAVRNVSVAASAWSADSTYSASGYGYKATVTVAGVSSSYIPFVNFSMADAVSKNYAPVAVCVNGGVNIWCKTVPGAAITIGSIVCIAAT